MRTTNSLIRLNRVFVGRMSDDTFPDVAAYLYLSAVTAVSVLFIVLLKCKDVGVLAVVCGASRRRQTTLCKYILIYNDNLHKNHYSNTNN